MESSSLWVQQPYCPYVDASMLLDSASYKSPVSGFERRWAPVGSCRLVRCMVQHVKPFTSRYDMLHLSGCSHPFLHAFTSP
jgi:hypothetical protein